MTPIVIYSRLITIYDLSVLNHDFETESQTIWDYFAEQFELLCWKELTDSE